MSKQTDNTTLPVTVEVSEDRLQAWVRLNTPRDADPPTKEEVVTALRKARIAISETVQARIDAFVSSLPDETSGEQRFLIAEGAAAVEPRDAEFVLAESLGKRPNRTDSDNIDFHSFNTVVTVDAGACIGTLKAAVAAKRGIDVFGRTIEPRRKAAEVTLDPTVRRASDDPQTIIAVVPGKIVHKNDMLSICEVVTVEGDVDFGCGNIDAATDVEIKGTVLDGFKVKSKKSIKIGGAIQGAEVEACDDVIVQGGILGRGLGRVRAGGQVVAKFAERANIRADGDIRISRECMNSRVYSGGKFCTSRGAVIGGTVYAREGVEVGSVGSEASIPTLVIVGADVELLAQAEAIGRELEAKRKTVDRIRPAVQSLKANLERLTGEQRLKATGLQAAADALTASIAQLEALRNGKLAEAQAKTTPSVTVAKTVYAGSRIQIEGQQAVFDKDLKGPVRIEKRSIDNVAELVAVGQGSGSVTVLRSRKVSGG